MNEPWPSRHQCKAPAKLEELQQSVAKFGYLKDIQKS